MHPPTHLPAPDASTPEGPDSEGNTEALRLLHLVMDKNGLEDKATVDPRKYKTNLCRNWELRGECPYLETCCFAHGQAELRSLADNHQLLASIGYFSNVVLLAMTNGKKPALPPHCLYRQPQQFPMPQTAEELQRCAAMAPPGTKFPYQRPLLSALRELKETRDPAAHEAPPPPPPVPRVVTPPSSESSVGSALSCQPTPEGSFNSPSSSFSAPPEPWVPATPPMAPMDTVICIGGPTSSPAVGPRRPRRRHPRHHKGHYNTAIPSEGS
eukprot:TRINITY_DN4903_c0_g1_i1.p1 TRINITY_DN4903_c0_g1~~TRINITY_DN4903_c0_g1_i1.p1  ORF type:complete len:269 (-),score=41.79 TRINITY_DN4903_c0_g1_i1:1279-2085(-)